MDQFKIFQDALEKMFPSLTVFSDLNWDEISREYLASHEERPQDIEEFTFNFPQFLQEKASVGDCPSYLFELAYFELLQSQVLECDILLPTAPGLHLNPTLSFLNLEFDINMMMDEAAKGSVQVFQRPHVLCIYRHPQLGLHHIEITTSILEILQLLEFGPVKSSAFRSSENKELLDKLIKLGVVIEVSG